MSLTKTKILAWAKTHSPFSSSALVRYLGISRQNVAAHLSALVESGKLSKEGATRGATYSLARRNRVRSGNRKISLIRKLNGLEEHMVFREIDARLGLARALSERAHLIVSYAFTEMLNNAIDHSLSKTARIEVGLSAKSIEFSIRDFGIGIFRNVEKKFKLANEFEALEHVLKGKQTTDPVRHSGEGIFFTSRVADSLTIRSHKLSVTIDNDHEDKFLKEERFLEGTLVTFVIRKQSRRKLSEVFERFTNADFAFDKSEVAVKLSGEGELLSRSQAKRILSGLDRYSRVVFDFKGVKELGQGFADEIFRVFRSAHPETRLDYTNANSTVEFMIKRALGVN